MPPVANTVGLVVGSLRALRVRRTSVMSSPRLPTASWCACVARQRRGLFRWLRRVGDTTLRIIPNQFVSDPEVLEGRDDMGAVWPFGKEIFALPAAGTSVPATAFRVMTQGRKSYAAIPHVRICAGGVRATGIPTATPEVLRNNWRQQPGFTFYFSDTTPAFFQTTALHTA